MKRSSIVKINIFLVVVLAIVLLSLGKRDVSSIKVLLYLAISTICTTALHECIHALAFSARGMPVSSIIIGVIVFRFSPSFSISFLPLKYLLHGGAVIPDVGQFNNTSLNTQRKTLEISLVSAPVVSIVIGLACLFFYMRGASLFLLLMFVSGTLSFINAFSSDENSTGDFIAASKIKGSEPYIKSYLLTNILLIHGFETIEKKVCDICEDDMSEIGEETTSVLHDYGQKSILFLLLSVVLAGGKLDVPSLICKAEKCLLGLTQTQYCEIDSSLHLRLIMVKKLYSVAERAELLKQFYQIPIIGEQNCYYQKQGEIIFGLSRNADYLFSNTTKIAESINYLNLIYPSWAQMEESINNRILMCCDL